MANRERILVVDDEPSIRKYLQTLLEVDGYEVETIGTGPEAIELLKTGPHAQRHHAFLLERSGHRRRSDSLGRA